MTVGVGSGGQRQSVKCIKTGFSVPQQRVVSNAIIFSTRAMRYNAKYNGLRPLILLGPNTPKEASSVLEIVRFYNKFMVRNVIIKMIVPRRTSRHGDWGLGCSMGFNRAVYNQMITVKFRRYPALSQKKNGWGED